MILAQNKFEYEPTGQGINKFHAWLMKHPKTSSFSARVWTILFRGLRMMEEIHWTDSRKNIQKPYVNHQIEIIMEYLSKYEESHIYPEDILVLALHDAIEDHPEYWKDILDTFGVRIFRDVLVLSTGGIPLKNRKEILEYFFDRQDDFSPLTSDEGGSSFLDTFKQKLFMDIVRIANPVDPFFKKQNESDYTNGSPEFQKIGNAITLYKKEIILKKHHLPEEEIYRNDSYIGLGNFLYFSPVDTRRKLQDMLHNMGDMETMEKTKPGYIATRRIKAYILGVKLKNFGMNDEYAELQEAFQRVDMQMLTDSEVLIKIQHTTASVLPVSMIRQKSS